MALNEFEENVLVTLADDVRRSDRRLYAALRNGRPRATRDVVFIWLLFFALGGCALAVIGDMLRQPWVATAGWVGLIAVALVNASRHDADGRTHPDGG